MASSGDMSAYLPTIPTEPVTVRLVTAGCAGKTIEHHERVEQAGEYGRLWRCPACDTVGDGMEITVRLAQLIPQIDAIRAAMNLYPVILLPSESPPGEIGTFLGGCKVYRVRGIDRPMVAIPGA